MQVSTQAIVIGVRDFDAEDRLLTLLTKDLGVIQAYANGANRLRSRLTAATSLFCYASVVLFMRKERYTVDHADSIDLFFGLREDLDKLALATYFVELAGMLAPQGEPAEDHLRLLLNTLHLLEHGKRTCAFLKPLYELRILTLSGYMPNLVACRECARFEGPEMALLLDSGELLCGDCLREAPSRPGKLIPLPPGVLAAMRHCIYSPLEKLFSFTLPPEGLAVLGDVAERYLIRQTEKQVPSLDFYKSVVTACL